MFLLLHQMFIMHLCFYSLQLYSSGQLGMSNMEKCFRNKIIVIIIIIIIKQVVQML